MKRFLALLLCICMVFSLAACNEEEAPRRRPERNNDTRETEDTAEITYGTYYLESYEGNFTPYDAILICEGGTAYGCSTDDMTYVSLIWTEDGQIGMEGEPSYADFEMDGSSLIITYEDLGCSITCTLGADLDISAYKPEAEEPDDPPIPSVRNDADFDGTLTIGLPKSSLVTDYYENYYTQWLEEKTGYDIEFRFFASNSNDYKTQLNTMIAGKLELPDILFSMNLGQTMYERYGQDGVLVDVSGYFNDPQKSAAFRQQLATLTPEAQENTWRQMQSHDGSGAIYVFPEVQESVIDSMDYQVWINREWLDTLNLDMPTDTESLYNVLKAFKTRDPNGNGIADEIPLIGTSGSLSGDTISWLINMFVYCDESKQWNVDENGNLYLPQTTDAYRDALKYIRKLYKEGLLSPLTLSSSSSDLQSLVCPSGNEPTLAGIVVTHLLLGFVPGHEGLLNYEALPLWGNAVFNEDQYSLDTFITKDCKSVDAAWELLMVMYSEESSLIQRYGQEGVEWDWAPEGAKSVMGDGYTAQVRLYQDSWGTQGNTNWRSVGCTILPNAEVEGVQAVPSEDTPVNNHMYKLYNDMLDCYYKQQKNYNPPEEQICPMLVWPENYKDQLPTQRSDCPSVITKYRSDFITGKLDINSDTDWNSYLNQLKNVGVDDWQYYAQLVYNETVGN